MFLQCYKYDLEIFEEVMAIDKGYVISYVQAGSNYAVKYISKVRFVRFPISNLRLFSIELQQKLPKFN